MSHFAAWIAINGASLLLEARDLWQGVTMLCVTHDVGETLNFPRVLVIEDGHIIEDGDPAMLSGTTGIALSSAAGCRRSRA